MRTFFAFGKYFQGIDLGTIKEYTDQGEYRKKVFGVWDRDTGSYNISGEKFDYFAKIITEDTDTYVVGFKTGDSNVNFNTIQGVKDIQAVRNYVNSKYDIESGKYVIEGLEYDSYTAVYL